MANEELDVQSKMRSVKAKVEENSGLIDKMVDSIVHKYNRDLHEFMEKVVTLLKKPDRLTTDELEDIVMKIPVFMYFSSTGLETLGIEGDAAKAVKMEIFNKHYNEIEGTIEDKKKHAELKTFSEYYVEVAFSRAYKKLKVQLDMAAHVFSGAKKVLSRRMEEAFVNRMDNGREVRQERYGDMGNGTTEG